MVLGCGDPYFIVLDVDGVPCCFNNGMNGVACRHEMVARESVVTDHVTSHRSGNTSHRGGNVLTAVEMFSPRWECFHLGGNTSHRGGNILTAVGIFSPRWECSHHGGNVLTAVGMFPPR